MKTEYLPVGDVEGHLAEGRALTEALGQPVNLQRDLPTNNLLEHSLYEPRRRLSEESSRRP